MKLLRRHPVVLTLIALVILTALRPLPALVDAATGSSPGDAELVRPATYVLLAPLSSVLDALTFLTLDRARWALAVWAIALAAWGARRPGALRLRVGRALVGPLVLVVLAAAAAALPRPVPRLLAADSSVTVIDYHAHTQESHDGRSGWTATDLARWHAAQGFEASYVTDHNTVFSVPVDGPIPLLPGVEWSVHRQHVVALGSVRPVERDSFAGSTLRMLGLFAELHRQGAAGIASIPEYWRNHWPELDRFVAAGVDGFEIVNCAPKAIGLPGAARRRVLALASRHDRLAVGASDHHGWGKVTCVWNLAVPGAQGYRANRVLARSLALAQGDSPAWSAALTQPWLMFRALAWSERVSWITWTVVLLAYAALPRRAGQRAGLGVLARSLSLKSLFARPPERPS